MLTMASLTAALMLLAGARPAAASQGNCTVRLTTGQSSTPCVLGLRYGCFDNNNSMWAAAGEVVRAGRDG
eukprot:COSAG04_NODE_6279_length_1366_cov_4.560379_3_plen_69_part_01